MEDAIQFLEWCNTPVYRSLGDLGYSKRVQPQFPDYLSYIIIDKNGHSIFPKGTFLSTKEVYEYWLKNRNENG